MSVTKYRHHIDTIKGEDYVLHKDYTELMENLEQEIERLNNVIDELEKFLIKRIEEWQDVENFSDDVFVYNNILDKLKELKEGKND